MLECDGVLTTPSVKMHIVRSCADAPRINNVLSALLVCYSMQQHCSARALLCINIAAACSLGDTYSLLKCIYAGSTLWGLLQIQLLHTYYTHQQCAVLIRQKVHKQSHMHQQRQLSYYGSLLLRRADKHNTCIRNSNSTWCKVQLHYDSSTTLVCLKVQCEKMHFYSLHQHCEVWCISCNPFMHQHSDALFGPRPHTATDVFSRTSSSSSCLFVLAK